MRTSGLLQLPGATEEVVKKSLKLMTNQKLQVTGVVEAVSLLIAASESGTSKVEEELRNLLPTPSPFLYQLEGGRAIPLGKVERPLDVQKLLSPPPSSSSQPPIPGPSMVSRAVLPPVTSLWLARTWALALLTFCTLGSLLCLLILYYVVVKMREGTLVGNQTMGLLLLLSVLLLFLSVPPWLVPPSHTVCALRHSAHLLALALCLGVLLVKVV